MTDALTRLRASGLISVCLINGSCIGGGAELATVCGIYLWYYKMLFTVTKSKISEEVCHWFKSEHFNI